MQPYLANIWPRFFRVFNDSNQKYRLKFFADPIVHYLWSKFTADMPGIVAEYIELAGNSCANEALSSQVKRLFIKDIQKIQLLTSCQIM